MRQTDAERFAVHRDPMMDYFIETFSAFVRTARSRDEFPPPDMNCSKELQVIRLYEYARAVAGDDFLGLAARPLAFGDYSRIFESECSFNCRANRFAFPLQLLQRRIVRTPEEFDTHIHTPIGNIVQQDTLSRTWKQMVKRALRADIGDERPLTTIDALAGEFGVSSQTLRRRLAAEGTSYRTLKAEARREAALDALSAEDTSLSEASLKAGFVEPNGLSRALRASQGISSRQLLDQIRDWQGGKTRH